MVEIYEHLKLQETNSGYLLDIDILTVGGSIGFAHAWVHVTPETQRKILKILPHIMNPFAVTNASITVPEVNSIGHEIAKAIAAGYLIYEAMKNIYRWWNGKISGKRVAKNIADPCATVAAAIGGSIVGATMGSCFGSFGTVVSTVIGGLVGSAGGGLLINMLSQELFDTPNDEALENAYNILNVNRRSTDDEINNAFYSLSVKYHPDKGGSYQDFVKLQTCMEIIKVARGEKH
uniref:J domain-containing protein n=1 Tax=Plectus sambesii TaxID=2011161 RepID=A0A914UMB6_9BILA